MATRKRESSDDGWRRVLADFLTHFEIDSKEEGRVPLKPWGTQRYALDQISDGMDQGIRFFIIGKGRQYGITTILIPVDVLWALLNPGIEGAIIGHKQDVLEVCRAQINDIQTRLPDSHRARMKINNKDRIEWQFSDGSISTIQLLVAGTSERKTDLGKGHGLSFIHGTEVGEWGSEVAFNSLVASLAQKNPRRLYMFESTGEGSNNLFARLWRKSLDDPERKCIFVPWWTHDLYELDKRTKLYTHYMANPAPSDDEIEIIKAAEAWGHRLSDGQIGWYRATGNRMTTMEEVRKNYPSVPEDMFQLGGAAFIPAKPLRLAAAAARAMQFDAYQVNAADHAADMKIIPLGRAEDSEDGHALGANLRVWEPPKPRGVYCVGVQPAEVDGKCRAISVIRCFADKVEQVAEFASETTEMYPLACVLAYLAGWYRNCWVNIDLDDGGRTMFREIQNLRNQVQLGQIGQENFFGAMIFYLYNRIDNVSGGSRTWNWEWNSHTEGDAFSDFKGSFLAGRCIIHSVPLTEEMGTLVQEDNFVEGDDGSADSRARAICIALRTYVDHVRLSMQSAGKTMENEHKADIGSAPATFLENIVDTFISRNKTALAPDTASAPWLR